MITAQFLIERHCLLEWHPDPVFRAQGSSWPDCLPLCVWVELRGLPLPCGGRTFRVLLDREIINSDGLRFTLDPAGSIPHVCEHMGHLIE
jgi:hypothetical protein